MPAVRGHNEGTVFQRKDGRWVAAVTLPDGRRMSRYAKTKPEARDRLAELKRIRDAGTAASARMTLGSYLARWLEDVRPQPGRDGLAPATWRKHEQHCRVHLIPELGATRMSDLSVAHVRAYLRRHPELDPQTLRHHRATLRRALSDAVRDGLIARNVAGLAEAPALPHRERSVLDESQVDVLLEGTKGDDLHALWALLATTGCREAEALGLTWDRIDLDAQTYRIDRTLHRIDGEWTFRGPKTHKSRRSVFLPAQTVAALRAHRARQQEWWMASGRKGELALVFTTRTGRPIHGANLTKHLYAAADRLGLPRVTVHDLRHTAATILYANGVPLEAIADMLGHSTVRVTQDLYRHRVEAIQRDAADAMERALSRASAARSAVNVAGSGAQ